MEAPFSNLHIVRNIPRLVSGKFLGNYACFANREAEIEGYAFEVPKDAEGSMRIFNVECDLAFRHEPATIRKGAFLTPDSYGAIGKPHSEDERTVGVCPHLRQFDVPGKACRCTLKYALPDEFILPGLSAFEGPTICENVGTDPNLTASSRNGRSHALPTHGADHFVHSLLGLSRTIEK